MPNLVPRGSDVAAVGLRVQARSRKCRAKSKSSLQNSPSSHRRTGRHQSQRIRAVYVRTVGSDCSAFYLVGEPAPLFNQPSPLFRRRRGTY